MDMIAFRNVSTKRYFAGRDQFSTDKMLLYPNKPDVIEAVIHRNPTLAVGFEIVVFELEERHSLLITIGFDHGLR